MPRNSLRPKAVLPTIRSNLPRYALTLLLVGIAFVLRLGLQPVMGQQSFSVFLATTLVCAWIGGVGPALTSLILLHIAHGYWFQSPGRLIEPTMASIVTTTAYYLVGITVGLLSQRRSAALRRAREQEQEALSQREHLRTTLSCMADGVIVTDVDGRLTLMNAAAETMTGWSLADAKGKPWWEVFVIRCEDQQERVESPVDRVLTDRRVVHESMPLVLTSRTGRTFPIAYSAAPVQDADEHVTGVVLIFRDESERRRTELALLNADRRKDEFLAMLAHELRNPLAPIAMGLELLKLSAGDPSAAEEVRSMMHRQTQHMIRLIDDLLDVSRITRGKFELRQGSVAVAEIFRSAVEATRPLIEDGGHQLTVRLPDRPLLLYADSNRLIQVLTNLLNNAAKYTPRGGSIELAAAHVGGEIILTVSDSGIGIPPDKLDSVFDMFTQIHDGNESGHTGLGIGLTLAKRLVEMHHGSIEVESGGGNLGTTFRVRLPALPEPPALLNGVPHAGQSADFLTIKRRVLVVDDNADALESLSRFVALMGNEVRRAQDGLKALEIARTFKPDIVLMDLGMPNLNGYETARRMRQEPWGGDLALVATTGWGQEDDRRRTAEAGFDRHLVKPIAMDALREVLETLYLPRATKSMPALGTEGIAVSDGRGR